MRYIGLDFGTTNSAVAIASGDSVELARYGDGDAATSTFRSVLYFDPHQRDARGLPTAFAGPRALQRYLASDGGGRLIQSIKSHVASRLFNKTSIFGKVYTLEELVGKLAERLRTEAEERVGPIGSRIVCGRPVHFAGAESDEDDAFATSRLRAGLALAGFDDVTFELEPIGAAYHYERTLDHDELVLIADFGGGTSDFCLARVGPGVRARGRRKDDILGTDGVALAGDAFDGAIVTHAVAPALGLRSRYRMPFARPQDDTMEVPPWIYGKLRRWHHLSFLKSKETMDLLRELRKQSLEPAKLEALIHVVEADLGYQLYRTVEKSKVALSSASSARLVFDDEPARIDGEVQRASFEAWIGEELRAIGASVDRLLDKSCVAAGDVDRVFMTGGSSLVPAVRAIFATRFGEEKLRSGDELTSVALGLALRARDLASEG